MVMSGEELAGVNFAKVIWSLVLLGFGIWLVIKINNKKIKNEQKKS